MAITTRDSTINAYLSSIQSARYGSEARSSMASSVIRCYNLAIIAAGGPQNGVTNADITVHANRIRNAVFGEEVRDALKTGLSLCYSARGKNITSSGRTAFNSLIEAQTGEDLKNAILQTIGVCCQDVSR